MAALLFSRLFASLLSCNIGRGDEVLLPSFTFLATANSVISSGANPIFVDIDLKDYTIDIEDLRRKITVKSKAIIPVHLYGYPANMDHIKEISKENNLFVIEDSAQSLGASYNKIQTGAIGDMGCFSFYPSKVITSGEGGIISTNNSDTYIKLKMIRNHGMFESYNPDIFGLNFRMPEIEAAIATVQMKKLPFFLKKRRENAEKLSDLLKNVDRIILPKEKENRLHNWYLYTISVDGNRDRILEIIHKKGIGASIYYKNPIHKTRFYSRLEPVSNLPNTSWAADHVISLPVHPDLTDNEIEIIGKAVKEAVDSS